MAEISLDTRLQKNSMPSRNGYFQVPYLNENMQMGPFAFVGLEDVWGQIIVDGALHVPFIISDAEFEHGLPCHVKKIGSRISVDKNRGNELTP